MQPQEVIGLLHALIRGCNAAKQPLVLVKHLTQYLIILCSGSCCTTRTIGSGIVTEQPLPKNIELIIFRYLYR
eukprot:5870923-Amphidinium_carterae.2